MDRVAGGLVHALVHGPHLRGRPAGQLPSFVARRECVLRREHGSLARSPRRAFMFALAFLIAYSTLLVKQHLAARRRLGRPSRLRHGKAGHPARGLAPGDRTARMAQLARDPGLLLPLFRLCGRGVLRRMAPGNGAAVVLPLDWFGATSIACLRSSAAARNRGCQPEQSQRGQGDSLLC